MKQNPSTAIKAKFSNAVHKILEPNIDVKARFRWQKKPVSQYTDAEKLKLFEEILKLHTDCSKELTHYQYQRREKNRITKARIERGYVPKKKNKGNLPKKTA